MENKDRIYDKALKGKRIESLQAQLELLTEFKNNDTNSIDDLIDKMSERTKKIEEAINALEDSSFSGEAWDFSKEKEAGVLVEKESVLIKPFIPSDKDFYYSIEKQWASKYSSEEMFSIDNSILWDQTTHPFAFFCKLEIKGTPVGYIAIKDSRKDLWEVAAEFDKAYCYQGYGPRCIPLFLKALEEITGRNVFRAKVEVDNYASQRCMEKIGAELVGLATGILTSEEEQMRFEEENMDLIDEHMIRLAAQTGVEPRNLLSHLLEYRIEL